MTTGNPDNVSILIQSYDTGLTPFITRTASPTCCVTVLFLQIMSDVHEIISVDYHWISYSRCDSSRDVINEIFK